jgi:hypothetical protein
MEETGVPDDRFTKVIVNRKSKINIPISLCARIRAFHLTSPNLKSYDLWLATSNFSYNGGKKRYRIIYNISQKLIKVHIRLIKIFKLIN